MTMADEILELVATRRNVTFVEMRQLIYGFDGDKEMVLEGEGFSNIVLWSGLSDQAVDAIEELRLARKIHATPTNHLTYLIDGVLLNLPIAKGRRHYKKPHWVPVVFNPGPDLRLRKTPHLDA